MSDPQPPAGEGISRERFLAEVARPADGALERRPDDGWIRADPWPLGEGSRRALRSLADALIPPPPAPRPPDILDRVEAHVRFTLPYMPRLNAHGFMLLVRLVDLSPLWRLKALSRLSRLPRERACEILAGLTHSRLMALRQLMLAIKGLILPAYFDQDEIHVALGYDPRGFMAQRVDLRGRLMAGEAPAPSDKMGPHSPQIRAGDEAGR